MATRPYQGYPYANPCVTDAPSVDAASAGRWNNLPRRAVQPPIQPLSQISRPNDTTSKKSDADPEPDPVIYIDVPESGDSDVTTPASPESEPEYVQETIFYDPFENRRIDRLKPPDAPDSGSDAGAGPSRGPARPTPPNYLDLGQPGSSGYGSSMVSPIPYLSKETSIYGREDSFNLSPLPEGQFHEPPPAYSEFDTPLTPHSLTETPISPEPPRTVVITQGSGSNRPVESSIGLPSPNRKQVNCQHCGHSVHTLVIWENGLITHAIAAILCILMLWPLLLLIYCTKLFKYKNHYCPNCNKKIGHEIPALCIIMRYETTDNSP